MAKLRLHEIVDYATREKLDAGYFEGRVVEKPAGVVMLREFSDVARWEWHGTFFPEYSIRLREVVYDDGPIMRFGDEVFVVMRHEKVRGALRYSVYSRRSKYCVWWDFVTGDENIAYGYIFAEFEGLSDAPDYRHMFYPVRKIPKRVRAAHGYYVEVSGGERLWFRGENRAADAIVRVTCGGEDFYLIILRPDGTFAFPGGFVDGNEKGSKMAREASRREVKEETGLSIPRSVQGRPVGYFDLKGRDPRGDEDRWVSTRAFFYDLGEVEQLPTVTHAGDPDSGSQGVYWFTVDELERLDFYGDHRNILCTFLAKGW